MDIMIYHHHCAYFVRVHCILLKHYMYSINKVSLRFSASIALDIIFSTIIGMLYYTPAVVADHDIDVSGKLKINITINWIFFCCYSVKLVNQNTLCDFNNK